MNNQNAAVILVVDDDKEIVAAISDLLRRDGYSILRAYDGMEALDLVFSNDIQLILMDVMMPRMDGISAMISSIEASISSSPSTTPTLTAFVIT